MPGPFFQLIGAWTPEEEMSKLLGFAFSGFSFGTIVAYPLSGQLCTFNFHGFGGWPLIYYVPGIKHCRDIIIIEFTSNEKFQRSYLFYSSSIHFDICTKTLVSIQTYRKKNIITY